MPALLRLSLRTTSCYKPRARAAVENTMTYPKIQICGKLAALITVISISFLGVVLIIL